MKRLIHFGVVLFILAGVSIVRAQSVSTTPAVSVSAASTTPSSTQHHKKKKKVSAQATVQPTVQVTVSPTVSPTTPKIVAAKPTATPAATPVPVSQGAINSSKIYDHVNMPGDFRRTLSYAVKTLNGTSLKHSHTVFLDLEKVSSNKDDKARRDAYVRFDINELEFGGPRNPWILLAGTVFEQSGDDCKVDCPIELAVDFKDIKVNYEGSKLGEIQKGQDIAAQVYEILNSHTAYQLILQAGDQVKDAKYMDDTPAYVAKARDGYAIVDFLNNSRETSR
jgi:hypothetical protein